MKNLIKVSFITLLLVGLSSTDQLVAQTQSKMNVLFLVVDDLNSWLLENPSRYGGRVIAPNMRRLAESGVNFVNTYAASTMCTPSRTAVLSGVAPWRSGVYGNGYPTDKSPLIRTSISLPYLFRKSGYYTAASGKIDHGYKISNINPDAWVENTVHSRDVVPPSAPLNGWARSASGKPTDSDWGAYHLAEEQMNDFKDVDFAIERLKRAHTQPFFIACGIFRPHQPWYVPQNYFDLYPLESIVLPEAKANDLDDIPELGRALVDQRGFAAIADRGQYKEAIRAYLACTTFADAQIGRLLDALDQSPYRDNTIVVLWSDNGWHLGEKSHWTKGTLWEESTHVLMMFRVPGVTKANKRCERFVSLLDLYPTLVELAGLEAPVGQLDGVSLVPLLKDPTAGSAARACSAFANHMAIRTEQFRYIRYRDGSEEFYDCLNDPHEWDNLIGNFEYTDAINHTRALLPPLDAIVPEVGVRGEEK